MNTHFCVIIQMQQSSLYTDMNTDLYIGYTYITSYSDGRVDVVSDGSVDGVSDVVMTDIMASTSFYACAKLFNSIKGVW